MPHHLEPVPSGPADDPLDPFEHFEAEFLDRAHDEDLDLVDDGRAVRPSARPTWWRWVAIAVIAALVVAGPFAYVLSKLLS